MAQEKKNTDKKTSSKKNTTKKVTKKNIVKKPKEEVVKKEVIKEKKEIEKIGHKIFDSYEEPGTDKSKAMKEYLKKEDSPALKLIKENRKLLISFGLGLIIGLVLMGLFLPDRIATTKNGEEIIVQIDDKNITADDLYNDMKKYYSVSILLDKVDTIVLEKLYPSDNDLKTSVNETADYYISMYETHYGYTQEQFLSSNGFNSYDEFINYLTLDYRRNKYFNDYLKKLITDNDIKSYYDSNVYGDIYTKYISVPINDNKDDAKKMADEIISKLKSGKLYDDIINEYGDKIKSEDLNYQSFHNSLDDKYIEALKKLNNNSYTDTAVEEDSDYKIIFRGDQKEKASLDDVKNDIIEELVQDKKDSDTTLKDKVLDTMRKENKVSIKDTDLEKKYEDYMKKFNTAE